MPPIISIVGNSNSGKTTLIEKLIPELKKRGYRVGVIKHAHHGFNIDKKGKDSWRHKVAGADTVLVSSPGKIAMVKDEPCGSLDCLQPYFTDLDLVITEGYKREDKPKIEVFRNSLHPSPVCTNNDHLIAMVTDSEIDIEVPTFGLEAVESIVDFIENRFLKNR
jgi:molybdopterin-guanine dinucleotide biosynthesis protein B